MCCRNSIVNKIYLKKISKLKAAYLLSSMAGPEHTEIDLFFFGVRGNFLLKEVQGVSGPSVSSSTGILRDHRGGEGDM